MTDVESRAKDVFLDALDLPAGERTAFVARAAAGAEEVRRRVEELLAAHASAHAADTAAMPAPASEALPSAIGPYRVVKKLGEGGFGTVYLAEQEEPVRRQVALKIVKLGMDTLRVIARFDQERQALALMDHPNIARVLDAGATETGRPYFVMELVHGLPLTDHCEQRQLGRDQRLRLLRSVCLAVQHAHQKGVIHRDLKPSNVLVAEVDGAPLPKVIDFGIAKAVGGELAEAAPHTFVGQMVGTLAYMSPEQMAASQGVDTRSDVYALGVILYELLTGELPFDPGRLGLDAFRSAVTSQDAERPSSRPTKRLGAAISREIDWIALKCLAKEPDQRYSSAAGLAADIGRVLDHLPVEAAPPSAWYRVRKLARRHRAAAGAAAVALVALAAGGVTAGLALVEARRQAAIAGAVNDFLNQDLLASIEPSREAGKGREVTVRQVLDAAAARIEAAAAPGGKFYGEPLVEAAIRETLASSYLGLGELAPALPHLARAESLLRAELGADEPRVLGLMQMHAGALRFLGRFDEAEVKLLELLEIESRVHGERHPNTAGALQGLALLASSRGRAPEASSYCDRALAAVPDVDDIEFQRMRGNIAVALARCGRDDLALALLRRYHDVATRLLGADDPETLSSGVNLGVNIKDAQPEAATELLAGIYPALVKVLGPDHVDTITAAFNLGELYRNADRLDDADALLSAARDSTLRVHGSRTPIACYVAGGLARVRERQGRYEESEALARESLDVAKALYGAAHVTVVAAWNDLATALLRQGRDEECEAAMQSSLAAARTAFGEEDPRTKLMRGNLVNFLRRRGRDAEADALAPAEQESQ